MMEKDKHRQAPNFRNGGNTSVTIEPVINQSQTFVCSDTQTSKVHYCDSSIQTTERSDVEVQTDPLHDDYSIELGAQQFEQNIEKVAEFLHRVAPDTIRQLQRNVGSRAFDYFTVSRTDEMDKNECIFEFTIPFAQPVDTDPTLDNINPTSTSELLVLPCTCLDWNSTGSSICAGFGRVGQSGWDHTHAGVAIWNIMQTKIVSSESDEASLLQTEGDVRHQPPSFVLETTSSVSSVACHPMFPSIVAAGTYTGELLVWDTNKEDPLVARSRIDDYFHREPITCVKWFRELGSTDFILASVSGDGKLLLWTLENLLNVPIYGYVLKSTRQMRSKSLNSHTGLLGGTSFSTSYDVTGGYSSNIAVGTEAGTIFRGLLRSSNIQSGKQKTTKSVKIPGAELYWSDQTAKLVQNLDTQARITICRQAERYARANEIGSELRPIDMVTLIESRPDPTLLFPTISDFVYTAHSAPIAAIDYSPFQRGLFMSSASDGQVHLYSHLQRDPLIVIEPIPTDLDYIFTAAWSKARPLVFAVGCGNGGVYLYDLAQSLHMPYMILPARTTNPVELAKKCLKQTSSHNKSNSVSDDDKHESSNWQASTQHSGNLLELVSRNSKISEVNDTLDKAPIYSVAFNAQNRKLIACGDGKGRVCIWRLGWSLSSTFSGEEALLHSFARNGTSNNMKQT